MKRPNGLCLNLLAGDYFPIGAAATVAPISIWRWGSNQGLLAPPSGSPQVTDTRVPGFAYSRAFKSILQGVVWDRRTLDVWMMDSQAWVPGSMMFYTQPDPDIRRKIIAYLEANP